MNFALKMPAEDAIEGEEPLVEEANVKATIKVVTADPSDEKTPEEVYMSFQRKSGNAAVFGKFVKDIMDNKLNIFVEPKTE